LTIYSLFLKVLVLELMAFHFTIQLHLKLKRRHANFKCIAKWHEFVIAIAWE